MRLRWLLPLLALGCGVRNPLDPTALKPVSANDAMRLKLQPNCAGCHSSGDRGYFASLDAFENLLVYNPQYVVPGKPDDSELVKLLTAKSSNLPAQMPPSGDSFAKLAAAGHTKVTVDEVRAWIAGLQAGVRSTRPNASAVTVRRLSAEQVKAALYAQLGLGEDDFFTQAQSYGVAMPNSKGEGYFPVRSPDDPGGNYAVGPDGRHRALGGGSSQAQFREDLSVSPAFVQALAPMSQAWCRMAIQKADHSLLFPQVDPSAKSATAADAIKSNIAYLHLHFLGEPAQAADVDEVFSQVFQPIEAGADPQTAWVGVCSYFIRHPKWILY